MVKISPEIATFRPQYKETFQATMDIHQMEQKEVPLRLQNNRMNISDIFFHLSLQYYLIFPSPGGIPLPKTKNKTVLDIASPSIIIFLIALNRIWLKFDTNNTNNVNKKPKLNREHLCRSILLTLLWLFFPFANTRKNIPLNKEKGIFSSVFSVKGRPKQICNKFNCNCYRK